MTERHDKDKECDFMCNRCNRTSVSKCMLSFRAVLLEEYMLIPVRIFLGETMFKKSFIANVFEPSFYSLALITAQL